MNDVILPHIVLGYLARTAISLKQLARPLGAFSLHRTATMANVVANTRTTSFSHFSCIVRTHVYMSMPGLRPLTLERQLLQRTSTPPLSPPTVFP